MNTNNVVTNETADKANKKSYIVGIGASAGGLEALQKFLSVLPPNTGFPYIIVQHLSPDYKSLLGEILGKYTEMPVIQVEDGIDVKPNCVYVIQPGKNMRISQGKLRLSAQREKELNLPIDMFFRSLAEEAGSNAIAIILSGTGSDGTNGIKDIKEHDGMIIVQDLDSSKFDGMPFAQWHYPFENKELFEKRYPADFISEAIDQTRGWFYTLSAEAALLFDDPSFLSCIVMGHVQDKEGRKMSKHLGNVVDPWSVLDKQGADAVRWYFYTSSMPWLPNRFSAEAVSEYQRKFMGTLWNTYAFYVLYAEIDQFDPTKHKLVRENLSPMDLWVLSRMNTLVASTDQYLQDMKITEAGRELQRFVDDLSNWYVRRCRERYWGKEMTADKEAAYMTLYTVLETLSKICAPFIPFMSEMIYQNIVRSVDENAPESVHLCDWPAVMQDYIDADMEKNMDEVLSIVVLGRAARNGANIKNRQPIGDMYVQGSQLPENFVSIIAEELNVKKVAFVEDASSFISYRAKPQLKTLGPRYGKILPKINAYLQGAGVGDKVVEAHKAGRNFDFEIDGVSVSLTQEDVLIDTMQKEGFVTETERELSVVLDTNLTPALLEEGFVRELVSKIQTMRKEAGFEVMDHIAVFYEGSDKIADIFARFGAQICGDTLAECASAGKGGYSKEWDINGEKVTLGVEKK